MHANKFDIKPGIHVDLYPLLARSWNRGWPDFVSFAAFKKVKIRFKKGQRDAMLLKQVQIFI